MMEETARVLQVREGQAYVSAQRQSSCGHCSARAGCGTSVLSRYIGQRSMNMWVDDPLGVAAGDEVLIQLQEGGLLKASLFMYLMPLLLFIGFALLGEQLSLSMQWPAESMAMIAAASGLWLGYLWLRRMDKKIIHDNQLRPVIIKRLNTISIAALRQ